MPERYRNFALAMRYSADFWSNEATITEEMELETNSAAHIKGIEKIGGTRIVEHLCTRVSTKRTHSFPLVQLIDTPGLVDGGVAYPFNVGSDSDSDSSYAYKYENLLIHLFHFQL